MTGIAAYAEKAMIDWLMGGASPTRPASWGAGVSLGAPTSLSASEVGTGTGLSRQSVLFAAAASPAGSGSNSVAMTFGPANASVVASGLVVFDSMAATVGNMLIFGPLAAARTLSSGDSLVIAVGALTFALA